MSLVGSGNPPLHRFRVGLEFAISGRRDLDGMIARHAALARALAERLGLPEEVQESVGSSYEQWDGKGWPGELGGDSIPVAARLAQFAEFVEVAHRVGGVDARRSRSPSGVQARSSTLRCPRFCARIPRGSSTTSTPPTPGPR